MATSAQAYLRKTFAWYDDLPTQEIPSDDDDDNDKENRAATVTDARMPLSPQEAHDMCRDVKFPSNFLYGSATAAYQIEGGLDNHCNWHQWELQGKRKDGHPTVEGHEKAGKACNSWELFATDLEHMKRLHMRMYRFSIEWSRIEPLPGKFDDTVLERYQSWCQQLRASGIEPMITLHHFTEPAWFVEKGGWENHDNLQYWQRFVQHVTQVLAPHCRYWTTLNEINGYAICGWVAGVHPPGLVDEWRKMLRVFRHLLVAHSMASRAIRAAFVKQPHNPVICLALSHVLFIPMKQPQTSTQNILSWILAFINQLLSSIVALFLNYVFNLVVLDAIFSPNHAGRFPLFPFPFHLGAKMAGWGPDVSALRESADWIAVNHYYRSYVQFSRRKPQNNRTPQQLQASPTDMFVSLPLGFQLRASAVPKFEKNEMGWDLTPSSMQFLLQAIWDRYRPIPIIITESGVADRTDQKRVRYIAAMLQVLSQLRVDGMDIRGYLIWSLLDNFEWAEGFRPRFGLLETNFETLERTERQATCDLLRLVFDNSNDEKK